MNPATVYFIMNSALYDLKEVWSEIKQKNKLLNSLARVWKKLSVWKFNSLWFNGILVLHLYYMYLFTMNWKWKFLDQIFFFRNCFLSTFRQKMCYSNYICWNMNYGWSKHMKKNVEKEKNWKINFQLNWNEAHYD